MKRSPSAFVCVACVTLLVVGCENTGEDASQAEEDTASSGSHSSSLCPAWEPTDGDECGLDGLACSYGSACCCGVCDSDRACSCDDGSWQCTGSEPCSEACPDAGSVDAVGEDADGGADADARSDTALDAVADAVADPGSSDSSAPADTEADLADATEPEACSETPRQTGEVCDTSLTVCAWGEVCCCGACDSAYSCSCGEGGVWACAFSDLCQTPECPDVGSDATED